MKLWEENIRKVIPYVPGEQPKENGIIKLNTNENPYPPTPKVSQAVAEFNMDTLKLYPDPDASGLVNVLADYYKENGGVIFPNPNAPTAVYTELDVVEDIIKHNQDVVVIVDEAYIDFGGKSAIGLIDKYENLLVVQTFSKSRSMAGMRIGYAMGNKELIKALNDVKFSFNSYTMNATSLAYGVEAVKDDGYFKETLEKIVKTREVAKKRLAELGFSFTDSKANFVFATHEKINAKEIFGKLKEKHIYVRYFDLARIDNYLRITVGTDEEMGALMEALEEIVGVQR